MGEMLSYFPARDVDEPASKELLRAEIADVKTEIERLRTDLHRGLNRQFAAMAGVVTIATTVIIAVLH